MATARGRSCMATIFCGRQGVKQDSDSICLFIGHLGAGGAERVMSWLANQLAASGFRITLVTIGECGEDFFPLRPEVKRIGLGMQKRNHVLLKPFANIQRIYALRNTLLKVRASRLIAFMPHENVMAVIATRGTGCRVVISERSAPWKRKLGWPWSVLRQRLYRFAEEHVAQTTQVATWLKETKSARSVHIIPNPVSLPIPTCPPILKPSQVLSPDRKCMVAMGGRPHLKGFDLLLEAFTRVAPLYPEWDLAIPGLSEDFAENSEAATRLRAFLERKELRGRVHLPGKVGNPGDWFKSADAFVLSSRTEGFPNVLIEAMAHGCPVAAFDCATGPRDIIEDGRNGLLVEDGSIDSLQNAMSELMADPALRERLGSEARAVITTFSEEKVLKMWKEVLS